MIEPQLYCAEQIVIPAKFPNILKTYAKAVIKTQPYDLLRWSAAYFRCMALNVTPPVKSRVEKNASFGHLTKGYLRVLLEQMGKGFFINRDVLQNTWENLSLPEVTQKYSVFPRAYVCGQYYAFTGCRFKDELLGFLSLCRMLQWPQVHWLKLVAVMVGSLNNNFSETLEMLCDLLTNEPDGGPSPIPMWMFRECYTFIAELNCLDEQTFQDGRKLLPSGDLEDPTEMPDLPKILDLEAFRNAILEKYNDRLGIEHNLDKSKFAYPDDGEVDSTRSDFSQLSGFSSSFKFIGDYQNPSEVIRRTPDFDSVILLLHETQGYELHSYAGPDHVAEKNIRHANAKEMEVLAARRRQTNEIKEQSQKQPDDELKIKVNNIQPPWSWIHEFASQNGREKSFNFVEHQSIASDETPSESSDESFDFEHSTKKSDSIDSCEFGVEQTLLADASLQKSDGQSKQTVYSILESVIEFIDVADRQKSIRISDTGSVLALVQQKTGDVLNVAEIIEILREAEHNKKTFENLNDLKGYLSEKLGIANIGPSLENIESLSNMTNATNTFTVASSMSKDVEIASESRETDSIAEATSVVEDLAMPQIEDKFMECAIEIDEKVASAQVPEKMIIGLMDTPSEHSIEPSPIIPTPPETPPSPTCASSGLDLSIISTPIVEPSPAVTVASMPALPTPPPSYKCCMPSMPGIGKGVSKETMQNFLTYLKVRSRDENGMVFPRMFKETKCPNMVDCYEM